MSGIWSDIRQAFRIVRSHLAFSLMAVLMLALGIGACTAIFTVVNAVLLRPLPYPDPENVVQLWEVSNTGGRMNVPEANFVDWKTGTRSFETMAFFSGGIDSARVEQRFMRARVATVSDEFFNVLKVKPAYGSVFSQSAPGAIVSYAFWQSVLGGGALQDRIVRHSNEDLPVVGVMPAGFNFPPGTEIWVPRDTANGGSFNPSRSAHNWSVIARLRNGTSAATASMELGAMARRIHDQYPDVTAVDAVAVPLQQQMTQNVRTALEVLLAAVGVLLLVACANVTNLLLAHIAGRQREMAVRTALGASRPAITRLFLTHSLILTATGGLLGLFLSEAGVPALMAISAGNLPRIEEIHTDAGVLGFAVGLSLLIGLFLGIVPSIRSRSMNLDETLKEGGRAQSHGRRARTARAFLVVAQVAMTIVLLVAAVLLGRSFVKVLRVDLGFQTEKRVALEMLIPSAAGNTPDSFLSERRRMASEIQQILERVSAMPGVQAAGGINQAPLGGSNSNGRFRIEGGADSGAYWPNYRIASPGYFEAIGIPLIRGRLFDRNDGASSPEVAIISKAVADSVWPGEDPIGKRINFGNMDGDQNYMTIVGIVGDIRNAPESATSGAIYVNYLQRGYVGNFTIVIHSTSASDALIPAASAHIRAVEPEASVRVQTLEQMFESNLANRRFNFTLLAVFGATALLLALSGVYGVTAYAVAQRRHEIGIRVALGARPRQVVQLFVREGSKLVLIGIAVGIAGAIASGRLIQTLLFNVDVIDIPAYLIAIVPMFLTAILASHIPARRAAAIDPMITLQGRDP